MARRNPTFSDADVIRIVLNNLTPTERDTVICTMVGFTGARLRGTVNPFEILDFLKAFKVGTFIARLLLLKDVVRDLATLPVYDRDF